MATTYNPADWYFSAPENANQVYLSSTAAWVSTADATYTAWLASGGVARAMPSIGALNALLGAQYPAGMPNPVPVTISPLAFRKLFTAAEMSAIYAAAHAAMNLSPPQPALQIWIDDLSAAEYVSPTAAETVAGINALVAGGWLTQARANQILTNQPPSA